LMNADGSSIDELTATQHGCGNASWSPDGSLVAYHSGSFEEWEIYIMNSDGTNHRRVTNSPNGITAINPVWRPN